VQDGDYYYMFYTNQRLNQFGVGGGIAIARALARQLNVDNINTYESYDSNEVWIKYFEEEFKESAIGGDTDIIISGGAHARVSWNDAILEWCMAYQKGDGLYFTVSDGGTSWYDNWYLPGVWLHSGSEGNPPCYYPSIVGNGPDGSDKLTSRYNWFYYAQVPAGGNPGHHTLKRRRLQITK